MASQHIEGADPKQALRDADRSAAHHAWHSFATGLAVALFLASFLTVLSKSKPAAYTALEPLAYRFVLWLEDEWFDGFGLRSYARANRGRSLEQREAAISLIRFDPTSHAEIFRRSLPIPRGRLACALSVLSAKLHAIEVSAQAPGAESPRVKPVVAIDVDVTPVTGRAQAGPDPCDARSDREAMAGALAQLSERAVVIALTMPRTNPMDESLRDEFIGETCARLPDEPSQDPQVAAGGKTVQPPRIFYASANLYVEAQALVSDFASRRKSEEDSEIAPVDPSLGNLIALAQATRKGLPLPLGERLSGPSGDSGLLPGSAVPLDEIAAAQALTWECEMAHRRMAARTKRPGGAAAEMVQASLGGPAAAQSVAGSYEFVPIDLVRAQPLIQTHTVFADDAAEIPDTTGKLQKLLDDLPRSGAYIVSVDDGSSADRFSTPAHRQGLVLGDWLHAAIAVTQRGLWPDRGTGRALPPQAGVAEAPKWFKWSVDVFAGCLFVVLAWAATYWRGRLAARGWTTGTALLRLVAPLSVAGVIILAAVAASAHWMKAGSWVNPALLILGMCIHAYIDAGEDGSEPVLERARGDAWLQWGLKALLVLFVVWAIVLMAGDWGRPAPGSPWWMVGGASVVMGCLALLAAWKLGRVRHDSTGVIHGTH